MTKVISTTPTHNLLKYCKQLATKKSRLHRTLRTTPPQLTQDFATRHDTSVAACLQTLLGLPDFPATSLATAHLPLSQGGLGLTSATVTAQPAYWASWADTFPVLQHQLPSLAGTLLQSLRHPHQPPPAFQAAIDAVRTLEQAGWQPPDWHALMQPVSHPLPNPLEEPLASQGWQHRAVMPIYTTCRNELLTASTQPAEQCSNHKPAHSPVEPSPPSLPARSSHTHPTCSAFFCSVVCVSPSRCLCVTAGAVALLTPLATTAQHVQHQGP